jgi:hypothetical protein
MVLKWATTKSRGPGLAQGGVSREAPGGDQGAQAMETLRELLSRKGIQGLATSLVATIVVTLSFSIFDHNKLHALATAQANAYVSIAQFAPWNVAERYVSILLTDYSGNVSEFEQNQQNWRRTICDSGSTALSAGRFCDAPPTADGIKAFYLSAHVPLPLRPLTAIFDLLLHALVDQGLVGFLVAAAQIVMGILATWAVIRRWHIKLNSFYLAVLGVPAGVLVLGSVAALPLYLLAWAGVFVVKGFSALALGLQAGCTIACLKWLFEKAVEEVSHEVVVKQLKKLIPD